MKLQEKAVVESVCWLGRRGFHGKTIVRRTGMSINKVRSILKANGIKLRSYRDGRNTEALNVIKCNPFVNVRVASGRGFSVRKVG